jgi:nicotinamide-nucleotide amidase
LGGDIGVAVSGVAGPDGGTQEKPIGLVCFAWSRGGAGRVETISHRELFPGDREQVRRQTVVYALERILKL